MNTIVRHSISIPILILLFITIVYALYSYFVPFQWDDLTFASTYVEFNNGSTNFNLSTLIDLYSHSRAVEAGRISNLGTPFMVLFFPHWLSAGIIGLVVAGIIRIIAGLSMPGHRISSSKIFLIWFLVIILFPWRDALMVKAYSLNYLVAALAILLVVKSFLSTDWIKQRNIISAILLGIFAFIAGAIHEGFTLPTLCGICLYAATRRFNLCWQQWFLIIGLIAGVICILTGNYHQSRIADEVHFTFGADDMLKNLILLCSGLILVGLSSFLMIATPRYRHSFISLIHSQWILFVGIAIAGYCMSLFVKPSPRVGTCSQLFSIIALLYMWRQYPPRLISLVYHNNRLRTIATGLIATFCFAHIITVISWQKRLYDEAEYIYNALSESPTGTIYYDIIPRDAAPIITLRACTDRTWIEPFQYYVIDISIFNNQHKNAAVVPTKLSQSAANSKLLEGTARLSMTDGVLTSDNLDLQRINGTLQLLLSTDTSPIPQIYDCLSLKYISPDGPKIYIHPYKLDGNIIKADIIQPK